MLLKAVFEATEVKTPTAFIILEEKLLDVVSLSVEEEEKKAKGRFTHFMPLHPLHEEHQRGRPSPDL